MPSSEKRTERTSPHEHRAVRSDTRQAEIGRGDEVRITHSPVCVGIVGGVQDGEAMVCLPIAGRWQLRGPFPLADLTLLRVVEPARVLIQGVPGDTEYAASVAVDLAAEGS